MKLHYWSAKNLFLFVCFYGPLGGKIKRKNVVVYNKKVIETEKRWLKDLL